MGESESIRELFFKINAKYVRASFSIKTCAIYYTLSSSKQVSACPEKKMFLAEWQAMQAQIPPLIGHWQTDCPLQHLGEDQTGNSQKETHQGYPSKSRCRKVSTIQVPVCVEIKCYARLKHISTIVLTICSQLQASDCHSTSLNNQHYVLLYCCLVNMLVLALVNIILLAFHCHLKFLLTGNCKLFHSILCYLFFRSQ
jgi:hypothetical protein